MALTAAKLIVEIGADTKGALTGMKMVSRSISQFAQSAQSTLAGVLGAQILQGAVSGIMNIGRAALDATVSWERLGFTIESMTARELRNADASLTMSEALDQAKGAAKDTLAWITKIAIRSPFPTETVAQAYRMQLSLGATSAQAKSLTEALLNVAAATGMSGAEMDRAAYAIAQIRGSEKLITQDLRQLINAGVDVNGILAKMGVKFSDVGTSAISSADFINAFLESSRDYAGAVDRMANSWAGMLGALDDVKQIGLRELFAGTLSALRPLVQEFTDWILGPGLPKLRELGDQIGTALAGAIPKIKEFALGGFSLLRSAFSWIIDNWPTISAALKGILTGLLAFSAVAGVATIITSLTNPLTWLVVAAAALGVAWQNNFLSIRDVTRKVFAFLLDWFWRIRGALMIYLPKAIEYLRLIWETKFLPPLQKVWSWLQEKIFPLLAPLGNAIKAFLAESFMALASVLSNIVFPILQKIWQELSKFLLPVLQAVGRYLADAIPKIIIGLTKTFQIATLLVRRFSEELKKLKLPSWLTPGSPTPFEMGLRGISAEMRKLSTLQMPQVFTPQFAPAPAFAGGALPTVSANESRPINLTVNITEPGASAEKITQTIMDALEGAYR